MAASLFTSSLTIGRVSEYSNPLNFLFLTSHSTERNYRLQYVCDLGTAAAKLWFVWLVILLINQTIHRNISNKTPSSASAGDHLQKSYTILCSRNLASTWLKPWLKHSFIVKEFVIQRRARGV